MKIIRAIIDFLRSSKARKGRQRALAALMAVVVFCTTYTLILPAITLDNQTAETEPGIEVEKSAEETLSDVQEADLLLKGQNADDADADDAGDSDSLVVETANESAETEAAVPSSENEAADTEQAATSDDAADVTAEESAQDTEEETQEVYASSPLIYHCDEYDIELSFDSDDWQLPEGTQLSVKELRKDAEEDSEEYRDYHYYDDRAKEEFSDQDEELADRAYALHYYELELKADGEELSMPEGKADVTIKYNPEDKSDYNAKEFEDEETVLVSLFWLSDWHTNLFDENDDESKIYTIKDHQLKKIQIKDVELSDFDNVIGLFACPPEKKVTLKAEGSDYSVTAVCSQKSKVPEDAKLTVSEIKQDSKEFEQYLDSAREAIGEEKKNDVPAVQARFFDIKIMVDGEEFTPEAGVDVKIDFHEPVVVEQMQDVNAVHFGEEGTEVLDVTTEESKDGIENVSFTADSFSVYGVVYTVDFTWDVDGKSFEYSIKGGDSISLKELIQILHVVEDDKTTEVSEPDKFIEEIETVEFSDESLVSVVPVTEDTTAGEIKEKHNLVVSYAGDVNDTDIEEFNKKLFAAPDWALITLQPFQSEECLTITLKGGEVFCIKVKDDVVDKEPSNMSVLSTADTRADGIKMWLFDYDLDGSLDDQNNKSNTTGFVNDGINEGHYLRFLGWGAGTQNNNATTINDFTGLDEGYGNNHIRALQGIVKNELEGGYPVLNNGQSLAYLFDPTANTADRIVYGGTTKEAGNVTGLFEKNSSGYYIYDSDEHYAELGSNGTDFTVYTSTLAQNQKNGLNHTPVRAVGFFPFNTYADAYYKKYGYNYGNYGVMYLNPDGSNGKCGLNHHLGVAMEMDFVIPKEGKDENGNPIKFNFSGDDDMWVFIDDQLVLDIGGLHQPVDGTIDFSTGVATITGKATTSTSSDNTGNKAIATVNGAIYPRGNNFQFYQALNMPDGGDGKVHTMKIFYLERGGCDSNCMISFNLPLVKGKADVTVAKYDQSSNPVAPLKGVKFGLYSDAECNDLIEEIPSDDNGNLKFENLGIKNENQKYYLKETAALPGYKVDDTIYTLEVAEDSSGDYYFKVLKAGTEIDTIGQEPAVPVIYNNRIGSLSITKNIMTNGTIDESKTGTFYYAIYREEFNPDASPAQTPVRTGSIAVSQNGTKTVTEDELEYGTYYVYELTGEGGTPIISGSDGVYRTIADTIYKVTGSGTSATVSTVAGSVTLNNNQETVSKTATKSWSDNVDHPTIYFKLFYEVVTGVDEDGMPVFQHLEVPNAPMKELPNGILDATWNNLPKYDANGEEYVYLVKEYVKINGEYVAAAPENYVKLEEGLTVNNTKSEGYDPKTSYVGKKIWVDTANNGATRPESIQVSLYANGVKTDYTAQWTKGTGEQANEWTYTFSNLPVFDEDGVYIKYTAVETPVNGYTPSDPAVTPTSYQVIDNNFGESIGRVTSCSSLNITLDEETDLAYVVIKKNAKTHLVWTQRAITQAEKNRIYTDINQVSGFIGELSDSTVEFISGVPIETVWSKGTVTVTKTSAKVMHIGFANHQTWAQLCYGSYRYNYAPGTTEFTNSLITTSVEATKEWRDAEDQSMTPVEGTTVTFDLFANGVQLNKPVVLNGKIDVSTISTDPALAATQEVNAEAVAAKAYESEAWKAYWGDLPTCDAEGRTIVYTVKEIVVPAGYSNQNPEGVAANGTIINKQIVIDIHIIKVDSQTPEQPLTGAWFRVDLYDADRKQVIQSWGAFEVSDETGKEGTLSFTGLGVGKYTLVETISPAGYIKTSEDIEFEIIDVNGALSVQFVNSPGEVTYDSGSNTFTVYNEPGAALPNTGGTGTRAFMILGSLMIASAGLLLMRRRKTA